MHYMMNKYDKYGVLMHQFNNQLQEFNLQVVGVKGTSPGGCDSGFRLSVNNSSRDRCSLTICC